MMYSITEMTRKCVAGAVLMIFAMTVGGCGNDAWQDLPGPVFDFVTRYFPSSEIESYGNHDNVQTVWIKDGPTLYFNEGNAWIRIDGNGGTLPAMLIYDEVPEDLYTYLEELEAVGGVYDLSRDGTTYYVTLSDSTIEYDIETGINRYVTGSGEPVKTE